MDHARVLSTGGAGVKLLPKTPKLSPQNVVTDHGIQEIFGLNRIESDLQISLGGSPQTPYTMRTSVVSYYIYCPTSLDRTLHAFHTLVLHTSTDLTLSIVFVVM